jgi:hypothetical protein
VKERTTNLKAELVPVGLEEGGQRLVLGLTEHKAKASPVTHAQQREREREICEPCGPNRREEQAEERVEAYLC